METEETVFFATNSISDRLSVWRQELDGDGDKVFLMDGIEQGFRISDVEDFSNVNMVHSPNHPSVTKHQDKVETELKNQIKEGHYKVAYDTPTIISPLAAIPKEESDDVRLVHDCSRPCGESVNDYSLPTSVQYESVEDAFKLATPNSYMCKINLKSAYRSVAIHPDDYCMTGLQFKFSGDGVATTLYDVRLPFGSRKGPMIFHRLSQSIKRMMFNK